MPSSAVTGGLSLRTSNTVKRKSFPGSRAVTFPSTIVLPSWSFHNTGLPSCQSDSIWKGAPPLKSGTHSAVYSETVRTSQTFEAGEWISMDLSTKSFDMLPALVKTISRFCCYVLTKCRESIDTGPFDDSLYSPAGSLKEISLPPEAATQSQQKGERRKETPTRI